MTAPTVCAVCRHREVPPDRSVCFTRVPGDPDPPADTSGNGGFDHFARTRFVLKGDRVTLLPDPPGGAFSVSMTPEQAEFLGRRILGLASAARADRAVRYPALYPEDAADSSQVRTGG